MLYCLSTHIIIIERNTMKNYNDLLYKKLSEEYDSFIADLKTRSPEYIIESAYESVIKGDLLAVFEYTNYTQDEAKALFELSYPLDAIYQAWLKNDLTYMDLLKITIDNRIESALKEI